MSHGGLGRQRIAARDRLRVVVQVRPNRCLLLTKRREHPGKFGITLAALQQKQEH
jgi:hypothetical protein